MASKGEAQSGTPQEEAVSPQLVLPEEAGVNTPDRISWDAQQGLQDVSSWGSQGEIRRVSLGRVCCSVCPRFGETFLVQLRRQTMQNQIGDCDSNDSTA